MTELLSRTNNILETLRSFTVNNIVFLSAFLLILIKSLILVGFLVSCYDTGSTEMAFIIKGLPSLAVYLYRGLTHAPSLILYISFVAGLLVLAFLFQGRLHIGFLLALDVFCSLLFIIDIMYYRAFASFVSPYVLQEYANLENLSASLLSMLRLSDVVFLLDIPLLCIIIYYARHRIENIKRNIVFFFMVILISSVVIQAKAVEERDPLHSGTGLLQVQTNPVLSVTYMSPIGYHLMDCYAFFYENRTINLEPAEKHQIQQWFVSKIEQVPDNKYKGMFAGKNLIVIQVESLETFIINKEIDGQEITPNINRMIDNSIYFPEFVEQVSFGMSSDADLLTNASVYPVRKGSTFFRYPSNKYISLPILLENLGYSTVAMHPDRGSFWNWKQSLEAIGFQNCLDSTNWTMDETINMGISDGCYLPQVEQKMLEQQIPFYSFVVTLTSHCPFELPEQHRELVLPDSLARTELGNYFQSMRYTDKHLGLFMESLERDELLENSVIVIYGDHEGVHKYYSDQVQNIKPSESWWRDNNRQVPLIIYQENYEGEVIPIIGGQIDTLPTLAYLMGVDEQNYLNSAMGRNLLKTNQSFAVFPDGSYRGDLTDENLKKHSLEALEIADMIIRSNYFAKH